MMHALRRGAKTWAARILLLLLVLSFAIWGIADFVGGIGQSTVLKVGDETIDARRFQIAYQNEINQLQRQLNTGITPDMARMFGVPQRVLGGLATNAAFNGIATELDLGLSEDELARQIGERYAPNGGFDRFQMANILRENGMTEAEFVEDERRIAMRSQLLSGLSGGIKAPDIYVEAFFAFQNEQRTVSYIGIGPGDVGEIADPSDADLQIHFNENQSGYQAPEYRTLRLFRLSAADIGDESLITDAEIEAAYANSGTRFEEPDRRRVYQLLTDSVADAEELGTRLEQGKAFEDLVIEAGKTISDVDLGTVLKQDILDPVIADIAFSLDAGAVSGAIDARFGGAIIKVLEIIEGATTPLETVAPALRQELALAAAGNDVITLHDEIEDARAGGATFDEIAERFSVELVEIGPISEAGADQAGTMIADTVPGGQRTVNAAYESDIGLETDPIELSRDSFVWFEVTDVVAPRDRTLDEVRDRVVADWRNQRVNEAVDILADEIAEQLRTGTRMSDLAADRALEVRQSEAFSRDAQAPEGLTNAAMLAAFDGPQGHIAVADSDDGGKIVLEVTSVTTPAFMGAATGNEATRQRLEIGLENDLIQRFVEIQQDALGIEVNQALVQQLLRPSDGTTSR